MNDNRDEHFKVSSGTDGVIWCVAVKRSDEQVEVTGTKANNSGKVLSFNHGEWQVFLDAVKKGEFDL